MHFILYLKIIGEENAVKLIAHHTRTICGMLFEMGTIYFLSIHKWMILFQFSNVENKLFKQPRVCNKRKYLLLLIKYDNFRTERLAFHQTNNISKGVNSTNELNFNSHYEFSFFQKPRHVIIHIQNIKKTFLGYIFQSNQSKTISMWWFLQISD